MIPIKRVSRVSIDEFYMKYVNSKIPVVFCDITQEWDALSKWDINYFRKNYFTLQVQAAQLHNNRIDSEKGIAIKHYTLAECIENIDNTSRASCYAIGTSMDNFPEQIRNECPTPAYCKGRPFLRSRLFIGPKHSTTPLHQDLFENLYTVVAGEKRIILYQPNSPVYRKPLLSKLPNFAEVNPESPDFHRYPNFKHAQAYYVDLKPGETLYIPSFWWHYLRNTDITIAVSYWWGRGWTLPLAWMATIYKKLISA